MDVNLKGYEEGSNVLVFILEHIFMFFETLGATHLCIFSLSLFILFFCYIDAQLKLIALYVQNIPLAEPALVKRHLAEITFLHINVLGCVAILNLDKNILK